MMRGAIDGCWGHTVGGIGGHNNSNINYYGTDGCSRCRRVKLVEIWCVERLMVVGDTQIADEIGGHVVLDRLMVVRDAKGEIGE